MHWVSVRNSAISSGYAPVQIAMALALIVAVIVLRKPLMRLTLSPANGADLA
jgi:hypothetical protein